MSPRIKKRATPKGGAGKVAVGETMPLFPDGPASHQPAGGYDKALRLTSRPLVKMSEAAIDRAQKGSRFKKLPCGPDCVCCHHA